VALVIPDSTPTACFRPQGWSQLSFPDGYRRRPGTGAPTAPTTSRSHSWGSDDERVREEQRAVMLVGLPTDGRCTRRIGEMCCPHHDGTGAFLW